MGYENNAVLDGVDRKGPSTLFGLARTVSKMNRGGPDASKPDVRSHMDCVSGCRLIEPTDPAEWSS